MNQYDHEDAFAEANRTAGKKTKLADVLRTITNRDQAQVVIGDCQRQYSDLFDAFIEGVEYGRKNPKAAVEGIPF